MEKLTTQEIRELGESLGFKHRATNDDKWITFTYEGTNTHVVLIMAATRKEIMKQLGDNLVKCGRIQQRQNFLREFNTFNYS